MILFTLVRLTRAPRSPSPLGTLDIKSAKATAEACEGSANDSPNAFLSLSLTLKSSTIALEVALVRAPSIPLSSNDILSLSIFCDGIINDPSPDGTISMIGLVPTIPPLANGTGLGSLGVLNIILGVKSLIGLRSNPLRDIGSTCRPPTSSKSCNFSVYKKSLYESSFHIAWRIALRSSIKSLRPSKVLVSCSIGILLSTVHLYFYSFTKGINNNITSKFHLSIFRLCWNIR